MEKVENGKIGVRRDEARGDRSEYRWKRIGYE